MQDKLILDWCLKHGWEDPRKINGDWWAIAPNSFIPEPVPVAQHISEWITHQTTIHKASALFVNNVLCQLTEETSFEMAAENLGCIDKLLGEQIRQKRDRRPKAIIKQEIYCPVSAALGLEMIEKQQKQKQRVDSNQELMRSFLKRKFSTK
jgi:hypothetical protein